MQADIRRLIASLPLDIALIIVIALLFRMPELGVSATAFALLAGSLSLSLALNNRLVIMPRFVQVSLQAVGEESDKKYRVVAEVMNIGGRSADKCTCEVERLCDGGWEPLPEKLLLDFVPVDTPVGKMKPLREEQTFSIFPNTIKRLRNYIPERLREQDKLNLRLKLDANGVVQQYQEFGLPDWTDMIDAQKHARIPSFNVP